MFIHPFSPSVAPIVSQNQEGTLFKVIELYGKCFPIYYGYYEECDRKDPAVEPMPIYPNFIAEPQYTDEGFPFVTKMQDACEHYKGVEAYEKDCAECQHYRHGDELLGICVCEKNRKNPGAKMG